MLYLNISKGCTGMSRTRNSSKGAALILFVVLVINVGIVLGAGMPWHSKNPAERVNLEEVGVFNANLTGHRSAEIDGYLRNVEGQGVHSRFLLNSNSCASCHLTHQGLNRGLTFQTSVYNTCTTCHFDETMNTANVLTGEIPGGVNTVGGRFFDGDFIVDERIGVSFHLSTGLVRHWEAPGSGIDDSATLAADSPWRNLFTCGSCHTPHGSYGGRHIHYNPNGQAQRYYKRPLVYNSDSDVYLLQEGERHLVPWLYADQDEFPQVIVIVYKGSTDVTEQFSINYAAGEIRRVNGTDIPDTVTFSRAHVLAVNADDTHQSGVTELCLSCHTEFVLDGVVRHQPWTNTKRPEGYEVVTFNHSIDLNVPLDGIPVSIHSELALEWSGGESRLTCLTCHFAHGTDLEIMKRRDGLGYLENLAVAGVAELPPYTANLRYINPNNDDGYEGRFEACYLCHNNMFLYEPKVTATIPERGSSLPVEEFSEITSITVEFNIPLSYDAVDTAWITVINGTGVQINGVPELVGDRTLVLPLTQSLQADTEYTVTMENVKAWVGGTLFQDFFTFSTEPEEELDNGELTDGFEENGDTTSTDT